MAKRSREKAERRELLRRDLDRQASQQNRATPPEQGQFVARFQGTVFQGPLPPPEILIKYNEACPGAAERILAMAEKNQTHRHQLEQRVIPSGILTERIGQILGFILYLATIASGTYLVANNKDLVGIVQMLVSTGTFAALYFKGQAEKKKELAGKRP